MKNNYFPNDFIHGVLSAHCADETGSEAGKSKVQNGDKVEFAEGNRLYQLFRANKDLDFNEFMSAWEVHEVIEDVDTGYLGIIYENNETEQIVLAHRSTNFELSLTTKNLLKKSGVEADLESALIGNIVEHQAHGFIATKKASEYSKEKGFSFSITGHSLGAWLAELSVYYCNTVFDCKYVKGVTFDGPGSRNMIKLMSSSYVDESRVEEVINSLYVVSYVSAPNIVNCANKHIGEVYRLFPEIETYTNLFDNFGKMYHGAIMSTFGHDLSYILPSFDPYSGKPTKYEKVESWPSITHKEFGKHPISFSWKKVEDKLKEVLGKVTGFIVIKAIDFGWRRSLGEDLTTMGSVITFMHDLYTNKIEQQQFWNVHRYLDIYDGFNVGEINQMQSFNLLYKGHYKCVSIEDHSFLIRGGVDRYFKTLKRDVEIDIQHGVDNDLLESVQEVSSVYECSYAVDSIEIIERYRRSITISQLRDKLRDLVNNNEAAVKYIDTLPVYTDTTPSTPLERNLKDMNRIAGSFSPNSILFESSSSKHVEYAKKLCGDMELKSNVLSTGMIDDLLNYLWLQYSIAGKYLWKHDGSEAKSMLLDLKDNIKKYVLNKRPNVNALELSNDAALMQEIEDNDMKIILLKTLYLLGRTYFYIKSQSNKEEALEYFRFVELLSRNTRVRDVEGWKNLRDLYEVHLLRSNALGVIMREDAEYYVSKGIISYAKRALNETIELYKECINDDVVYKMDHDHRNNYIRIKPSENAYALVLNYEYLAKSYLILSKIDSSYREVALESLIGDNNSILSHDMLLSKVTNKRIASILNTLSEILLVSSDEVDFEYAKEQILKLVKGCFEATFHNLDKSSSILDLIKVLAYISKDISRKHDHTTADASQIIIEVLNGQVKELEDKISSDFKRELEDNQQNIVTINQELGRGESHVLQVKELNNVCEDIGIIFEKNAHKAGLLSEEAMSKDVGEELIQNTMYDNRGSCIEEIFKLGITIFPEHLGQALINAASKGYADYVLSIVRNTNIYSKTDKMTAISIASNILGPCVKFCFEEKNNCHYIQPVSSFYQWASYLKGDCITIQPTENCSVTGEGYYSEVVSLIGEDLFQHTHDEL